MLKSFLSTNGTHEHYEGYQVRIINAQGELSNHFFKFNTYFKKEKVDSSVPGFKIIEHCCDNGVPRWYINEPTKDDIILLRDTIVKFIGQYRTL